MVRAVGLVPGVVTVSPGQGALEGAEEIVERPGDDHVVVGAHDEGDGDCCQTNTYKEEEKKKEKTQVLLAEDPQ